jgi:hypothetical protein
VLVGRPMLHVEHSRPHVHAPHPHPSAYASEASADARGMAYGGEAWCMEERRAHAHGAATWQQTECAHPHIRYTRPPHAQPCAYERGSVAYERGSVETGSLSRVSCMHPCATRTGMRIRSMPCRPRAAGQPEAYERESESETERARARARLRASAS